MFARREEGRGAAGMAAVTWRGSCADGRSGTEQAPAPAAAAALAGGEARGDTGPRRVSRVTATRDEFTGVAFTTPVNSRAETRPPGHAAVLAGGHGRAQGCEAGAAGTPAGACLVSHGLRGCLRRCGRPQPQVSEATGHETQSVLTRLLAASAAGCLRLSAAVCRRVRRRCGPGPVEPDRAAACAGGGRRESGRPRKEGGRGAGGQGGRGAGGDT